MMVCGIDPKSVCMLIGYPERCPMNEFPQMITMTWESLALTATSGKPSPLKSYPPQTLEAKKLPPLI